ncbi:unnamed protein product [Miscanthus lutarioriparius]|uniref:BTB domain-containing protein n=1 Tax=Miscanthus lutarioriparius TaxID=422564 RepID=A0A811S5S9_9POAL|nr:unnamed protein product [Miscanthus lutarioriparius]
MRSPVFDAQFYGPMREDDDDDAASKCSIAIEDMQPAVFRALLHFIYMDSMPSMEGFDAGDRKEMVKHLLVAADRYSVERLKLMCEGILCKSLDAKDAETTLALADTHHSTATASGRLVSCFSPCPTKWVALWRARKCICNSTTMTDHALLRSYQISCRPTT